MVHNKEDNNEKEEAFWGKPTKLYLQLLENSLQACSIVYKWNATLEWIEGKKLTVQYQITPQVRTKQTKYRPENALRNVQWNTAKPDKDTHCSDFRAVIILVGNAHLPCTPYSTLYYYQCLCVFLYEK